MGARFKVGQAVSCRYKGGEECYPGRVESVQRDGSYTILYDDGDRERGVGEAYMFLPGLEPSGIAAATTKQQTLQRQKEQEEEHHYDGGGGGGGASKRFARAKAWRRGAEEGRLAACRVVAAHGDERASALPQSASACESRRRTCARTPSSLRRKAETKGEAVEAEEEAAAECEPQPPRNCRRGRRGGAPSDGAFRCC